MRLGPNFQIKVPVAAQRNRGPNQKPGAFIFGFFYDYTMPLP
ncbi:hypothetical protein COLO4_11988 [Corchorus olitorius]|uniref:Uncharacterized protein n=1 Tax=Corchorus olitorius TaxID=93759 RepID=A0A1R3K2F7_9ROSI|nr:hypothetical protein COLO4_11988 [Corchorus olitorius]